MSVQTLGKVKNMNTEQLVSNIAKMIEALPSDAESRKEIADIMNDALANYVIEDDNNTVFMSSFISLAYTSFMDKYYNSEELQELDKPTLLAEFYNHMQIGILDIIQMQLKTTLENYFETSLSDVNTEEINNE